VCVCMCVCVRVSACVCVCVCVCMCGACPWVLTVTALCNYLALVCVKVGQCV